MTMASTDQLTDTIQGLKQAADEALEQPSVSQFEALEKYVNEVDALVRETQQAMWSAEARQTIRKLEHGEPLTDSTNSAPRPSMW